MATRGWRSLVAGAVVAGLLAGCGSGDGDDKASASSAECPNGELTFGVQRYADRIVGLRAGCVRFDRAAAAVTRAECDALYREEIETPTPDRPRAAEAADV